MKKADAGTMLHPEEILHLSQDHPKKARKHINTIHPDELATLLLNCKESQRPSLLLLIPSHKLGDTLLELPESLQEDMLATLPPEAVGDILEHLNSDDAADLLQSVDKQIRPLIIAKLAPDERRGVEFLLAYGEETAGGLMQAELFKVRHDWDIDRVLTVLRRWGHSIENLNYVYVVDQQDIFIGVFTLQTLLMHKPSTCVANIADRRFPRATPKQDQEDVVRMFDKYEVLALPVVDENGILIGRITADDILDVVQEEATEGMYRLAALSDNDDLAEPVMLTARRRGVWLGVNLLTAILASWVVSQYAATIEQIIALAILMPIVASMGGIAGTQTLTVIVRGIALGRVTFTNARRALIREVLVGLVSGIIFATLIGGITMLWFPENGMVLGLIIATAMLINLIMAGLAGALIPLTLQRINIDPALASGTILTTITDVVGFCSFLGLATYFLYTPSVGVN
ncbi:MAG: magnesium transporter [Mariprofundaceae bacterium]|nr:magnesium transporter [Mariprofundaceae bacterium]